MAESIKVFELAKELNLKALELIDKIKGLDLKVKNHMADLTAEEAERIRTFLNPPSAAPAPKKKTVTRTTAKKAAAEAEAAPTVVRRRAVVRGAGETRADEGETTETSVAENVPVEAGETPVAAAAASEEAPVVEIPVEPERNVIEITIGGDEPEPPPTAEAAAPGAPETAAPPRPRGPRYSVIRVVSPEAMTRARPLIVEDAKPGQVIPGERRPKAATTGPVSIGPFDPTRPGSRMEDEESRRKKAASTPRKTDDAMFKSTDYLRRERVYQIKKKRLSIGQASRKTAVTVAGAHKRVVEFDTRISVENLGEQMATKAIDVMKKLRTMGVTQPDESEGFHDWYLDFETAQLVAGEFSYEVENVTFNESDFLGVSDDVPGEPRSPVITIMGHVDHGKTSLLDVIRRARVTEGEAGGITQHIGAYTVTVSEAIKNLAAKAAAAAGEGKKDKKKKAEEKAAKKGGKDTAGLADRLTFLDTPGHAAFTSMRARGAKVTDIVILVVSAVDGVMPQTKEAVDHAKAAGVPLIVAVNKIDLPEANPDRIKQQLGDLGITPEDWGGDTIFVHVSAKTGEGVDKLLEMIQLQAEVLDLKARPDGWAEGTIIEAKLDKGRGPVATVLVSQGLLEVGQHIVAGTYQGKVRALIDDKGAQVKQAGPSTPVEILGLSAVPEAGDSLNAVEDEKASKALAEHRLLIKKGEASGPGRAVSAEELFSMMAAEGAKELPIMLKADVKGSAEALNAALLKLPMNKIKLKILSVGVGGITESDVLLASASKAIIFGFNVRPDNKSQADAERRGVQVKTYSIIYDLIEDVTKAMEGMLDPTTRETVVGRAEVRNVFTITKVGAVAGSAVTKGKIQRSNSVRIIRDGRVVYTGKISGLKRFKDDAREVAEGYECGISVENYNDIKEGDILEAFTIESFATTLTSGPSANA